MQRLALLVITLAACTNPEVTVDERSIDVPRGAYEDVRVSIDGVPVEDLDGVYWTIEDTDLVTVTRAPDGKHLRIGADFEGRTVVRVNAFGQDVPIYTHVTPPAIVELWTVPTHVVASVGDQIEVRAKGLDTTAQIRDITFESRWTVRDESVVQLAPAGMHVVAMATGETSLSVTNDAGAAVVGVTIFK